MICMTVLARDHSNKQVDNIKPTLAAVAYYLMVRLTAAATHESCMRRNSALTGEP